jgi:CHASE1-domain containing sensor protein
VREHNSSQADVAFASQASNHANIIADGFSQAFFAIEAVGALYDSVGSVSSHQFVDFVTPLLERFPTITALGWAPQVHGNEREGFERTARDLFPGYRITERRAQNEIVGAVERQIYFPVYYISPYVGNEVARGFDLYSNQVRRAAIDRARDSGQTISTGRISLLQETANQYSLLLINPVFLDASFDERHSRFLGVASAVFRIGDGVERSLSQVQPAGLNIWLFDRSSERDKQFLYFHPSRKLEAKERKMETVVLPVNTIVPHF